MNKKGVWEEAADLFLGGSILMVAFVSFMLITNLDIKRVDDSVAQKISGLDNSEIFLSYLSAGINESTTLEDYITKSYYDSSDPAYGVDSFLEKVYSRKTCWTLYKEDNVWAEKKGCSKEEKIFDSGLAMPMPDKTSLKLRLKVEGYLG